MTATPCLGMRTDLALLDSISYSSGEKWRILLSAFAATLLDGTNLVIFPYYLVALSKEFRVDLASVSLIIGGSYIASTIGAIAFGHISDLYGRRPALALAVTTFSLFSLLSSFASNYEVFFATRMMVGFGLGGEVGIAYALVNETLVGRTARRGLASAGLQAMLTVGAVLAAVIYTSAAHIYHADAWRVAFGGLGVAVVLGVEIVLFMPESKVWQVYRAQERTGPVQRAPVLRMFRKDLAARIVISTIVMTFTWAAVLVPAAYAPTVWQTVYRMSASQVAMIGVASSVVLGLGFLAAGALSDRFGRRTVFANTAWFCALMYALFVLAATNHAVAPWIIATIYCVAFGSCAFLGISGSWFNEFLPVDVRSSAFNFIYYLSRGLAGGVLPTLVLLATRFLRLPFELIIGFGVIGAIGAAVFAYLLPAAPTHEVLVRS